MGTKERRRRERKQRETSIIEAAEELFFSNGFDQTTLEQIAGKIELSKAALYRYFTEGKQELYIAILARGLKIMNDMFYEATQLAKTGWEKIRAIGTAFYEFCKKYPGYRQFLFDQEAKAPLTIFSSKRNKHLRKYQEQGDRTGMIFFQAIKQGVSDNSIRSDIQPEKLMLLLSQASSGLIENLYKAEPFVKSIGLATKDIITLFYDLLGDALKPK